MSRYDKNYSIKQPKRSRTIPLYGSPDFGDGKDDGKWFKCWNCGHTCNVETNMLGGSESDSGVVYEEQTPPVMFQGGQCLLRSGHVGMALDSFGNAKSIEYVLGIKQTNGCPLCGSLNWRGDF